MPSVVDVSRGRMRLSISHPAITPVETSHADRGLNLATRFIGMSQVTMPLALTEEGTIRTGSRSRHSGHALIVQRQECDVVEGYRADVAIIGHSGANIQPRDDPKPGRGRKHRKGCRQLEGRTRVPKPRKLLRV